jgi:hypothetical protein
MRFRTSELELNRSKEVHACHGHGGFATFAIGILQVCLAVPTSARDFRARTRPLA